MRLKSSLPICRLILSFGLFILFSTAPLSAQSFSIETSRGIKTLEVPENMTIDEAYIEMGTLYLEERFDHEDLIESTETLLEDIKSYEKSIFDLQTLYANTLVDYKDLNKLYKIAIKKKFIIPKLSVGAGLDLNYKPTIDFLLGISIFEKFDVYTKIGYPFSLGIQIGVSL